MEEDGKWYGHSWSNWYRHVRSNRCKTGWQTGLRGESHHSWFPLYWKFWAVLESSWRHPHAFVPLYRWMEPRTTLSHGQLLLGTCVMCAFTEKQLLRICCCFSHVLLSPKLSVSRFPCNFSPYQPYNFIVIIHCGMSLDTHPSWRLCWADCLLIWWTNEFRHFLVSFCLFLLTFEIFVSKDEVHNFSF